MPWLCRSADAVKVFNTIDVKQNVLNHEVHILYHAQEDANKRMSTESSIHFELLISLYSLSTTNLSI
jgi:hypothetical protein